MLPIPKLSPLIIIAFFMIMQIEVAFATNAVGEIMPAAFTMNIGAPVNNAYVANQPSAAFGPISDQSTNIINKDIHNDLRVSGNKEGVDYLANNFGLPREVARKGLEKAKVEKGKEYPDSPYAKFGEMELPENGEQHGKNNVESESPSKDEGEYLGDNEIEDFSDHNQHGLSAIDEHAEMEDHEIRELANHQDFARNDHKLQQDDLRRLKNDPINQGHAPRRIRFAKTLGQIFANRAKSIVRQKTFNKRRDGVFTFLLGNRNYKSKTKSKSISKSKVKSKGKSKGKKKKKN